MKKIKILLFIALACILVLPFSVFAEGEEETTSSNKEVTLYFFRGEGCSHCAEFESWLEEIEPEYGNLFEVKDYETWYNEDNQKLMNEVAEVRGEEVEGVPYIIIGNKSWKGFAEDYKGEILNEIQSSYDTAPSKRYDVMKFVDSASDKTDKISAVDVIVTLVIVVIAALVVVGVVAARKNTK